MSYTRKFVMNFLLLGIVVSACDGGELVGGKMNFFSRVYRIIEAFLFLVQKMKEDKRMGDISGIRGRIGEEREFFLC